MTRQVLEFHARRTGSSSAPSGCPASARSSCRPARAIVLTSVALEKAQVSALAERIDQLLDEVTRHARIAPEEVPETAPAALADIQPLDVPIVEEFRVGAMALGWDDASRRVVIEAHAVAEEDEEIPDIADDAPTAPTRCACG